MTNPLDSPVQFEIKAPSSNLRQYEVTPSTLQLRAKDSVDIEIKLKLTQPPKLKQVIKGNDHVL